MLIDLFHYRVNPLIVRVGVPQSLEIQPLESQFAFSEEYSYTVTVCGLTRRLTGFIEQENNDVTGHVKEGSLWFDFCFEYEEECYIRIQQQGRKNRLVQLSVYALQEDLFHLRPLKGDFHVHSSRSDGREVPEVAVASYRAAGFDFTAITDHMRYQPSVEAQEAYRDIPLGMHIFNGEEVHTPMNYVHVIHFGGNASVNALFEEDSDEYFEQVEKIMETEDIPYADKFTYAANLWSCRRIHERGGLAIFCHPHWCENVHNVPEDLARLFLMEKEFDAFELIGGQSAHENNLQTAMYYEMRAKGCTMPVLGCSDSHGTIQRPLFNHMFTIVFAKENSKEAILEAVKQRLTAPVEVYEDSVNYSVHGELRLVQYTRFLMEHYFAPQALFCQEEGILMRLYVLGDKSAGERLAQLANRTDEYYKKSFGVS